MSAETSVILGALKALLSVFQSERHYIEKSEQYSEEQLKDALQALYKALTETRKYINSQSIAPDRDREHELSMLWASASIKSRKICSTMVSPSSTKAKYWASEIKWSREEIIDKKIDLETIENELTKMINHL